MGHALDLSFEHTSRRDLNPKHFASMQQTIQMCSDESQVAIDEQSGFEQAIAVVQSAIIEPEHSIEIADRLPVDKRCYRHYSTPSASAFRSPRALARVSWSSRSGI